MRLYTRMYYDLRSSSAMQHQREPRNGSLVCRRAVENDDDADDGDDDDDDVDDDDHRNGNDG